MKKSPAKSPKAPRTPDAPPVVPPAGAADASTPPGSLVPQEHGGALRHGSQPGNTPGTGRPKSEVRAAALAGAEKAIPKLVQIVESDVLMLLKPEVVAQAADKLLKYGLGTQKEVSVDEVKERLRKTIDVLRELLAPEQFQDVTSRLHTIWR